MIWPSGPESVPTDPNRISDRGPLVCAPEPGAGVTGAVGEPGDAFGAAPGEATAPVGDPDPAAGVEPEPPVLLRSTGFATGADPGAGEGAATDPVPSPGAGTGAVGAAAPRSGAGAVGRTSVAADC